MTTAFPFLMPTGSGRDADPAELWLKPGREAFNFWISFFPTAPLFGVEWRFANMIDPAANPFMMPGMPGMRAAAMVSHPGELDTPAAADEDAAKPVARAADVAAEAATHMTRIAGETGKAAARTANLAMKTGADVAKTAVDAQSQAADVAEETGETAKLATETALTAVEDAETMAEIAADEAAETARKANRRGAKAAEAAANAGEDAAKQQAKDAKETAEKVDDAIAAAPKPKILLDKRPKETDDLKGIKGIGPDLERQLNNLGLYRFDQLAKMSDTDLAWIDANITRFKGRCFRDDWVGQAKSRLSK